MKRRTFLKCGAGAAAGSTLAACGGGHDHDWGHGPRPGPLFDQAPVQAPVVASWNEAALQAIRVTRPGPPMAARSLAVLHSAMYNAWTAYDAVALATVNDGLVRRPRAERSAANKARAMSYTAHAVLLDQFPSQKAALDSRLAALGFGRAAETSDAASAQHVASHCAAAMLEHCHRDGANQLGNLTPSGVPYADYTGYVSLNAPLVVAQPGVAGAIAAPGNWQPLTYADASGALRTPGFLAACWDRVKPFALASASQFRPSGPALAGSPEFFAQAQRLVEILCKLTEREKVIAEYWSDGPSSELPPGHWCLFAQFVSARDRHNDDQDVKLFFALSNALFDAGIAAWDAKRAFNSARPISAIRYLMHGTSVSGYGLQGPAGGVGTIAGETWTPYQPSTFPTPPFPEHVSGHSCFSAAAAEVLRQFTGSDAFGAGFTKAAGSMTLEPGLPSTAVTLSWPTFSDAATEAGMSRIYGGIHFDKANTDGQDMGRKVGVLAFTRARDCWEGRG